MSITTSTSVHPRRSKPWETFEIAMCHVWILGICVVLIGAFVVQFGAKELPCPLCIIQRMCMILAALGPAFILLQGTSRKGYAFSVIGSGFGMSILAAVGGMAVSTRQVLLHIAPGDPGYGMPVFGMHLYTWALVVFITIIVVSGLTILFEPRLEIRRPERLHWFSRFTIILFGAIILANMISVLVEAGPNLYLPDNPEKYLGL